MAGQSYCTPKRFRLFGPGIDTSSFTNAQLRQKLVAASGMVDVWTNRTMQPSRADLRGGTITDEQHTWNIPNGFAPNLGDRRVYLNAGPIQSISAFKIKFTNAYEITLPPSNLYINAADGYIEIIASQPTIIGFPPIGWLFGLSQPVTLTTYAYGWQFAVTDDPCEADSPTLYYASHGNWLAGADVTITVAGSTVDPTDYAINYDDGSVTFAASAQPGPGDEVLAAYTYTLPQSIADATALIAVDLLAQSRIAARGLIGLSSLRVAEVAMSVMAPSAMVTKNGVSIPATAAAMLAPYALGTMA